MSVGSLCVLIWPLANMRGCVHCKRASRRRSIEWNVTFWASVKSCEESQYTHTAFVRIARQHVDAKSRFGGPRTEGDMAANGMNAIAATRMTKVMTPEFFFSDDPSSSTGLRAAIGSGFDGGVRARTAYPLAPVPRLARSIAILRFAATDMVGAARGPPPAISLFQDSARASALASASEVVRARWPADTSTLASAARPTASGSAMYGSGRTSDSHQRNGVAANWCRWASARSE